MKASIRSCSAGEVPSMLVFQNGLCGHSQCLTRVIYERFSASTPCDGDACQKLGWFGGVYVTVTCHCLQGHPTGAPNHV